MNFANMDEEPTDNFLFDFFNENNPSPLSEPLNLGGVPENLEFLPLNLIPEDELMAMQNINSNSFCDEFALAR